MFMGTPHQGGNGVAFGRLMVNVASIFVAADDRLLRHLERDSESLQQQLQQYGPIRSDFVTKYAFEEYPTPTLLGRSIVVSCFEIYHVYWLLADIHQVVPKVSAVVQGDADGEPIVIPADHINMVKFGSRFDPGYKKVSENLQLMLAKAGTSIGGRWDTEARVIAGT
jgi:hypothetical protein